jgi:hypothetical protein
VSEFWKRSVPLLQRLQDQRVRGRQDDLRQAVLKAQEGKRGRQPIVKNRQKPVRLARADPIIL